MPFFISPAAAQSTFQWIATAPENSSGLGYDGLAAIFFEKGLLAEAKEAMQKSLAANPANVLALLTQGDLFFAMGEKEKAIHDYLQAAEAETPWGWQKALAYNALGVSYFLESKQAEARSSLHHLGRVAEFRDKAHHSWTGSKGENGDSKAGQL